MSLKGLDGPTTVDGDGGRSRAGARWGWDESKAYEVDGDANGARHDHAIDWLEQARDLAQLLARVSEFVQRFGYDPEDLVILPRAELDRRELTAYSAGWADVVSEQLPAIRREYEARITAAYLQGQEDARTGRRPRRARPPGESEGRHDGEVIPLPYVPLLDPPPAVTRVEQRGERERAVADGEPEDTRPRPESPDDGPPSADDIQERRPTPARRRVVRRNGRPSVPPLDRSAEASPPAGRDSDRDTE
ncbi:hypothetical protein [Streptomyces adonidis]|uniref:Uncharacterized protein n=1 Tax=Streptomyces sp. NBC_00093 TaxID=2975649 RepID=A0AAU1ZZ22_9ACTN